LPNVTLSTVYDATNFDTKLHVYTGSCGSLTCVAGNDDFGGTLKSQLTFTAEQGVTYYIRVGGYQAQTGTYTFSLDIGTGGCMDPAACNYEADADWDDCSCCYTGLCGTLSLNATGTISPTANVYMYTAYGIVTVYPGQTHQVCLNTMCDLQLYFIGFDFWDDPSSYTLTVGGETFTGPPVIISFDNTNWVDLESAQCGCTDPAAINFSPEANYDDFSCVYTANLLCSGAIPVEMNSATMVDTYGMPYSIETSSCGHTNIERILWYSFEYNGGHVQIKTTPSGFDTVLGVFDGCGGNAIVCLDDITVPNAFWELNANAILSCEDGLVPGQTYYIATGILGTTGQMSLIVNQLDIPGCTDPLASNYQPCASMDDGTCVNTSCPSDLDGNGVVNVNDLLLFSANFGTSCPE
jgi:hypothetical protein